MDDELEIIEAYCVRCRLKVEVDMPQAVWTRRGMPATRGECPECGGVVFRMGKCHLHDFTQQPEPVEIDMLGAGKRPKLLPETVYVLYAEADEALARQLAEDLTNAGVPAWIHENTSTGTAWAGGVHPAIKECKRMVFVLSSAAIADQTLEDSLNFFKQQRKPIMIAQIDDLQPPDHIRRSPRFDFTGDYKRALRAMLQELG